MWIRDCFGGHYPNAPRTFLDIGAWDGICMSNTYELVQSGWSGIRVESSAHAFVNLMRTHRHHPGVSLVNVALTPHEEQLVGFYMTEEALSTSCIHHMDKWKDQAQFQLVYVQPMAVARFLQARPGPFSFISVDTEGTTVEVFRALPLCDLGTKLVCVEKDGPAEAKEIEGICSAQRFVFLHQTLNNVLYRRQE
jgi:FkbM family methyltransferase